MSVLHEQRVTEIGTTVANASREEEGVKGQLRPSPRSVPDPPVTPPAIAGAERAVCPIAA